jgi:hypothetical protein
MKTTYFVVVLFLWFLSRDVLSNDTICDSINGKTLTVSRWYGEVIKVPPEDGAVSAETRMRYLVMNKNIPLYMCN